MDSFLLHSANNEDNLENEIRNIDKEIEQAKIRGQFEEVSRLLNIKSIIVSRINDLKQNQNWLSKIPEDKKPEVYNLLKEIEGLKENIKVANETGDYEQVTLLANNALFIKKKIESMISRAETIERDVQLPSLPTPNVAAKPLETTRELKGGSELFQEIYDSVTSVTILGKIAGANGKKFKDIPIASNISSEYTTAKLGSNEPVEIIEQSPYTIAAYAKFNNSNVSEVLGERKDKKIVGLREFASDMATPNQIVDNILPDTLFIKRVVLPNGNIRVYFQQYQNAGAVDARGHATFFAMSFELTNTLWEKLEKEIEDNSKSIRTLMTLLLTENFSNSLNIPSKIILETNSNFEPSLQLKVNSQRNNYEIIGDFKEYLITK